MAEERWAILSDDPFLILASHFMRKLTIAFLCPILYDRGDSSWVTK
jgi:hypothetical protein